MAGLIISRGCLKFLVHPAADDNFAICRNAPYGQVLVLPSEHLVHPAADDNFVGPLASAARVL